QIAPPAVLEEGAVARKVERDPPGAGLRARPGEARFARGLRGEREEALGKPRHFLRVPQVEGEGLGRVEDVVREARRALGELLLDRVEALALLAGQRDS